MSTVLTVGHGAATQAQLTALLTGAGVRLLVDVRRHPGSRAHPHVARDALAAWLPEAGIDYRWAEDLGGRRRLPAGASAVDSWWTVASFRSYASHTRTPEFRTALDEVLAAARAGPAPAVAVMCSESVWWRCHRRLIADVLVLAHGAAVGHLMPDGRITAHDPAQGARLDADGLVVWDGER